MTVTMMMMNDDVDKDPAQKITDRKKRYKKLFVVLRKPAHIAHTAP
jgi:hypothetical protein